MKHVLLAVLLVVSGFLAGCTGETNTAAAIQPEYPDDLEALATRWVADAENATAPYAERAWYAELQPFLQKAKAEAEAGRVRATMFDLETTYELLRGNLIADDAAALSSDAEKKALVVERTQTIHAEAEDAWEDFRARLHEYDPDVRSLHSLEIALYSADLALAAKLSLDNYDELVPELRKATFSREATYDMLRASLTPLNDIRFADDILGAALQREGLPPALDHERWTSVYAYAEVQPRPADDRLKQWEEVAAPVRANNESLMAVAIALAEQRTLRHQQIQLTYGDAGSRGLDIVRDAAVNMEKRLNRTSYEDVRAHGLLGVATADAVDQARFVLDFVRQGKGAIGFITLTWSSVDHQEFVALVLADVSLVEPTTETNLGHQNNLTRYIAPSR